MKTQHTPGKWDVVAEPAYGIFVGVGDNDLAEILVRGSTTDQQAIANARLIAAAPQLLEALQVLLASAVCGQVTEGDCNEARAAIRAAKGE